MVALQVAYLMGDEIEVIQGEGSLIGIEAEVIG